MSAVERFVSFVVRGILSKNVNQRNSQYAVYAVGSDQVRTNKTTLSLFFRFATSHDYFSTLFSLTTNTTQHTTNACHLGAGGRTVTRAQAVARDAVQLDVNGVWRQDTCAF
jgi:hypothetical protein